MQISGVVKGYDTSGYELNNELFLAKDEGKATTEQNQGKHNISLGTVIKIDKDDGWFILNILKR